MDRRRKLRTTTSPLGRLTLIISFCSVVSWGDSCVKTNKDNPFTPKASLIRYWNTHITNTHSIPSFLLSKSSPLSAVDSAFFAELTARKALHSHLPSFCSSAKLFCPSLLQSDPTDDDDDATFAVYSNKRFSNYGSSSLDGVDTFKNYSDGNNFATSSFSRYGRSSTAHQEDFNSYANHANVANSNFSSYAASATGGSAHFSNYLPLVNLPNLRFSSYDSDTNGHEHTFSSYADNTNSGNQAFLKYANKGNDSPMNFTSYGGMSNVLASTFTSYSELGNSANDSFSSYGSDSNNPSNNFKGYSVGVNDGMLSFSSYRDGANAGTDTFHSYGKRSNSENMNFVNYRKSLNEGADTFTEYGKESAGQLTGFQVYGLNSTFKDYAPTGVTFSEYTIPSSKSDDLASMVRGICGNKCGFSGKFFREYMLREGMVMKMPDIRDRKPERSFLPRSILSKLPFSSKDLSELKQLFGVVDNSSMEQMLVDALVECERDPSPGETKQCVGSIEDMIDFAISILGDNVVVRTTENVEGSNEIVMLGKVEGINSGQVTKSVSCHQSLYPYLLYYCHFVPKVRVYLVDILGVNTKAKINHGVAICHVDTSSWSPGHGAFVALGSSPGDIEVCHWIYENDITWAMAD